MYNLFQEIIDLNEAKEKLELGNFVHLGFNEKDGFGVYGTVIYYDDKHVYVKDRNNKIYRGLIKNVRKIKLEESKDLNEAEEKLRLGDFVHVGLSTKDGYGFYGIVVKVDDEYVYVKDINNKIHRGLIKNVRKIKLEESKDLNEAEEKLRLGDFVHVGLSTKDGYGFYGIVVKVDDEYVYVKDINNKIHRGLIKNVRKIKLEESEINEAKEKLELGNFVHLGFNEKDGFGVYGTVIYYDDKHVYVKDRNNKIYRGLIKNVRKIKLEESEINESEEKLRLGDFVHVGLSNKGGHGFYGTVVKVDDEYVYIKNKDNKLYRGLVKNTTKIKFEDLKPTELKNPELVHKLTGKKISFSENKEVSEQLNLIRKLMAQNNSSKN